MKEYWDNVTILQAVDRLQRKVYDGGPIWSTNGLELIFEIVATALRIRRRAPACFKSSALHRLPAY